MDESEIQRQLDEIIDLIALGPDAKKRDKPRQDQDLQSTVDRLRILVAYSRFDLEATRRERIAGG